MHPLTLTPDLQRKIVAALHAGAFPVVAAEAWGVSPRAFHEWMKRGDEPNALEVYRDFATEVRAAAAKARLRAEIAMYENQPRFWLQSGPGRETAEAPGWTVAVKPTLRAAENAATTLRRLRRELEQLLTLLEPFPEARAVAAEWLWRKTHKRKS
jgi:hypothetical protein